MILTRKDLLSMDDGLFDDLNAAIDDATSDAFVLLLVGQLTEVEVDVYKLPQRVQEQLREFAQIV